MQPCLRKVIEVNFLSKSTICATMFLWVSIDVWYHRFPSGTPSAFSSRMYSAPTEFSLSEEYEIIFGIGNFKNSRNLNMSSVRFLCQRHGHAYKMSRSYLRGGKVELGTSIRIGNSCHTFIPVVHCHDESLVILTFDAFKQLRTYSHFVKKYRTISL